MAVDLTLAKAHLRKTASDEDTIITTYLNAAKEWVEDYTSKKLASEEVTETKAAFPSDYFTLRWGPTPTSIEVGYTDEAGDDQTITTALLVDDKLYPPEDTQWPTIDANTPVTITYTVGYSTVPAKLDQAVLLLVTEFYENRSVSASETVWNAVYSLCEAARVPVIA